MGGNYCRLILRYYPDICPEGLRGMTKRISLSQRITADIRTEHLLNSNQKH
jgi:hypothetical protein